jgi:hypothetical protein
MTNTEMRFDNPTELLAALPHLLGFIPRNDIVAIMLGADDQDTGLALRAAIRCPVTITRADAEAFPNSCNLHAARVTAAILIAVCEHRHDEHAYHTLHTMRGALQDHGITVAGMFLLDDVTRPGLYHNLETLGYGEIKPYTDSAATARDVYDGRVIAESRAHMAAEFATHQPALDIATGEVTEELIAATATALRRAIHAHTAPDAQLAARTGAVITAHVGLRDAFLRLGDGHERSAGWVWTHIAAQHRGHTRAELLTMAALAYYCAADTVRAGLALHAATDARDDDSDLPTLAGLLLTALRDGLPPNVLRTVIPTHQKAPIPGTTL